MILVTGATGTSGSEIVKALLSRAERPRVLVRDPEKAAKMLGDDIEIARGDFEDPASLEAAMEDVDRALLLVNSNPKQVELEKTFIDVAKRVGVARIVKFSVIQASPNAGYLFARMHGEIEEHLKKSGLAWTMLRPTFFMQNLLGMADMIKAGAIYQPAGEGQAAYVDVRDIAAVAAAALMDSGHEGKSYDITGPQLFSMSEIAATLTKVLGREIKFVDVPKEAARDAMIKAGLNDWYADAINDLTAHMKAGKMMEVSNTVKDLAKKQPITLEQFIRDHRETFS